MARFTLFALLLCSVAAFANHNLKVQPKKSQPAVVMPGGDPPPPCPIKVCKF
jgi:hypothetical protein